MRGEIAVKACSLIGSLNHRRVGMDAHAVVVVWWVSFRFFSELLFFACPKNK